LSSNELRRYLAERLPEYMVPGVIEELAALPLTANGKVDRARLPEPSAMRREAGQEYQGPRSPLEAGLVEIWEQLLRVERVGIRDNFFALGGHSLLATRLMSRVRETFGKQLPLRRLFEHPTVAELAEELERTGQEGGEQGTPALVKVGREAGLPLSFAQQRLWFLDQLEPGSTAYNMPGAIRISGELEVGALERSLATVVRRHESLRTRFEERDGQPRQVIEAEVKLALRVQNLEELGAEEREERVQQLVAEEGQRAFELSKGPLLRAQLLRLSETEHLLLLTLHHIIADGWSVGILTRELTSFYQRAVSGAGEEWEELELQYGDYAVWQREWLRGEKLAEQLAYWREQLAGAPAVLGLPTDQVRPAVQSFRGGRERLELAAELMQELQQLSQAQGARRAAAPRSTSGRPGRARSWQRLRRTSRSLATGRTRRRRPSRG
jgi:acyl carrier protein